MNDKFILEVTFKQKHMADIKTNNNTSYYCKPYRKMPVFSIWKDYALRFNKMSSAERSMTILFKKFSTHPTTEITGYSIFLEDVNRSIYCIK